MLEPTPYLRELRDLVKADEPELWGFFASAPRIEALVEDIREHLLRSTYRLEGEAHDHLRRAADAAAARLGVTDPVTLYQATGASLGEAGNASCLSMPGEVHLVFSGGLLELLGPDELTAVIGHELAHHVLWSLEGGDFWVLDRLMHASAEDLEGTPVHDETARLVRLNTELVADRGALLASEGDAAVTIAALVKLATGLRTVSAQSYLQQAVEVLDSQRSGSGSSSHPETYFRAWALDLWASGTDGADDVVAARLLGELDLEALDLVSQHRLTALSQRAVRDFLAPEWVRTAPVLGHARVFGGAAVPKARGAQPAALRSEEVTPLGPKVANYLAYVLLDLATVDEEIEPAAFAQACTLSQSWGIGRSFDDVARKELGLSAKDLTDRRRGAAALLSGVG